MEASLTSFLSAQLDELAITIATRYNLESADVRETMRGATPVATTKTPVKATKTTTPAVKATKSAPVKATKAAPKHESILHADEDILEEEEKKADTPPAGSVCSGVMKKDGEEVACKAKGKEEHNGSWYCGRHITGAKKVASKSKAPSKAPQKKTETTKPPVISLVEKTKAITVAKILDKKGQPTGKYWDAKTRILFNKQTREAYAVLAADGKTEKPLGDEQIRFLQTNHIPMRQDEETPVTDEPPVEEDVLDEEEEEEGSEEDSGF